MKQWVLGVAWLAACELEGEVLDEQTFDDRTAASVIENGQNLNGQNLNGQNLNGQNLNGSSLGAAIKWVSVAGSRLNGASVTLAIVGSELRGTRGGQSLTGAELVGVELQAVSDTESPLALRIAAASAPAGGSDVWRYRVEYRETDDSWQPICLASDGAPLDAIALAGYWDRGAGTATGGNKVADPGRFTFACRQVGALGKCVDMGYRPWAQAGNVSLDRHHQACVRMIRNDYCGDGTAHTVDGNTINVYDAVGIQADTRGWLLEAEWDHHGARCLSPVNNRAPLALPCRLELLDQLLCGFPSHFYSGALLMTERPLLGG